MRSSVGVFHRYRPSPAMAVAVIALFVALGGTGYAASSLTAGGHEESRARDAQVGGAGARGAHARLSHRNVGVPGRRGPRGPQGPTGQAGLAGVQGATGQAGPAGIQGSAGLTGPQGSAGPMGPRGEQGSAGIQGVPGTARAYAFVEPSSTVCHCTPTTPLRSSLNVSLGANLPAAPSGTWCFVLDGGIDPSTAVVVASVEGAPGSLDSAQWVAGAPDCSANQIEIQTVRHIVQGGSLSTEQNGEIPFSFVVP